MGITGMSHGHHMNVKWVSHLYVLVGNMYEAYKQSNSFAKTKGKAKTDCPKSHFLVIFERTELSDYFHFKVYMYCV